MDWSQQELPLTAYNFCSKSKETRSRVVHSKKVKSTKDSLPVTRSSKRRKGDAAVASPVNSTVRQSKLQPITLQLPTPAASTRKRVRGGSFESERDLTRPEFEPSSDPPQSLREAKDDALPELSGISLPTPATCRRKLVKLSNTEFVHDIDGHSHSGSFNSRMSSKPNQAFLDQGLSCSSVPSGSSDPFHADQNNTVFAPRHDASGSAKQLLGSEMLDDLPSNAHVMPMIPVPSSQSQYLVHIDATPKRKQCYRRAVKSSQSQEEAVLISQTPRKYTSMVNFSVSTSPTRYTLRGSAQGTRYSGNRGNQRAHLPDSPSAGLPINSSAGPLYSFFAAKNAADKASSPCLSPSQRKSLVSYHSSDCNPKTLTGSARQGSTGNHLPACVEDSLTESESDSDVLRLGIKDNFTARLRKDQVPHHSPVSRSRCGFGQDNLESGSETEAESEGEIYRCFAEIGKKRRECKVPRQDTPPPLIISPLVSPTKPRFATASSVIRTTGIPIQAALFSVPHLSTVEQPQSESLPSVVRDFICMFPGDESYPADFPESLRV